MRKRILMRMTGSHPDSFVVPAKAGTHSHRRWRSMEMRLQLCEMPASVVMGPGSRSLRSLVRDDAEFVARVPIQFSNNPDNFRAVMASEAKQSMAAAKRKMDCFVASLLAMTATVPPRATPSYSAKAEYPVRRCFSLPSSASLEYWIARLRGR